MSYKIAYLKEERYYEKEFDDKNEANEIFKSLKAKGFKIITKSNDSPMRLWNFYSIIDFAIPVLFSYERFNEGDIGYGIVMEMLRTAKTRVNKFPAHEEAEFEMIIENRTFIAEAYKYNNVHRLAFCEQVGPEYVECSALFDKV